MDRQLIDAVSGLTKTQRMVVLEMLKNNNVKIIENGDGCYANLDNVYESIKKEIWGYIHKIQRETPPEYKIDFPASGN